MKNYRAMYERYEESELHEVIEEAREAEQEELAMTWRLRTSWTRKPPPDWIPFSE